MLSFQFIPEKSNSISRSFILEEVNLKFSDVKFCVWYRMNDSQVRKCAITEGCKNRLIDQRRMPCHWGACSLLIDRNFCKKGVYSTLRVNWELGGLLMKLWHSDWECTNKGNQISAFLGHFVLYWIVTHHGKIKLEKLVSVNRIPINTRQILLKWLFKLAVRDYRCAMLFLCVYLSMTVYAKLMVCLDVLHRNTQKHALVQVVKTFLANSD